MPIQQVMKCEGDNSIFIWKHSAEDFNTHSQLIVHESQEANFFLDGQPMDLFGSGKYTFINWRYTYLGSVGKKALEGDMLE